MTRHKTSYTSLEAALTTMFLFFSLVHSDTTIPSDKSKINLWFDQNIQHSSRKTSLDHGITLAEAHPKVIQVQANGKSGFKTINDAIKSIPINNKNRIIVKIGPGKYSEKIKLERNKPFVTFYGDPNDMPVLVYDGTAAQFGTVDSATLIVESDYFIGANLRVVNSAPRPDGKRIGAQAVALRISGDKSSFYNCKFYGFQDTLCDDKGKHFFKDCYVEGTYDFIFGGGKSLYLSSEIHVIPGGTTATITAQSRKNTWEDLGFSFVHCNVTGTGGIAYLGRAWRPYPRVVFAYSDLSDVVNPRGWSNDRHQEYNRTVYFGEYNNVGPGSDLGKRASFTKKLKDAEAREYVSLDFVESTSWLLPPI